MGVYLLDCDEKKAKELWKSWFEVVQITRPVFSHLIIPVTRFKGNISENGAEEDEDRKEKSYTQLFLEFRPTMIARVLYITVLLLSFISFEKMLQALPNIGTSVLIQTPFFVFFVTLFICLIGLSPLLLLGYGVSLLRKNELAFQKFVTDDRFHLENVVPMIPLAPPQTWVLFPGDAILIQVVISGVFFIQFFKWFGAPQIFVLLIPFLLITFTALFQLVVRRNAFERIAEAFHVLMFWKLELARLAGRVLYLFLFPLLFYLLISLLRAVSLSLPIAHKKVVFGNGGVPTYFYNTSNVTIIGNPLGLETWQYLKPLKPVQTIIYVIDPTLQGLIFRAAVILIILLGLLYLWRFYDIANTKHLKDLQYVWKSLEQEEFLTTPLNADQTSIKAACRNVILLNWCVVFIINTIGIVMIMAYILWMFNRSSESLTVGWTAPLEWYQEAFKSLFGNIAGSIISQLILLGICMPALFWIGLWLLSLTKSYKSLILLLFSREDKSYRNAHDLLVSLCKGEGISAPPILRIERNSVGRVDTTPLLPITRFCMICLSEPLITSLTKKQQELVLKHELTHAIKHARLLWWTQFFSLFSFTGSAYLSLLLDYQQIEFDADNMTVEKREDIPIFEEALNRTSTPGQTLTIPSGLNITKTLAENQQKQPIHNINIIRQYMSLYEFYFGTAIWGKLYPPIYKRIENLYHQFSATEKEGTITEHSAENNEEEREFVFPIQQDEAKPISQMKEAELASKYILKCRKLFQFCLAMLMLVGSIGLLLHNAIVGGVASDKAQEAATAQTMNTITANNATIDAKNATIVSSNATADAYDTYLLNSVNATATADSNAKNPDPYHPSGGSLVFDNLLNQPNEWGDFSDSSFGTTCQFINGAYHAGQTKPRNLGICPTRENEYIRFALEIEIKFIKGDCGGILVHYNNNNDSHLYLLCMNGSYYFISISSSSQKDLAGNYSSAIHKGPNQSNTIAIVAEVNAFDLYVNDQKIDRVQVTAAKTVPTSTSIGMIVACLSQSTEVIYSHIREWSW